MTEPTNFEQAAKEIIRAVNCPHDEDYGINHKLAVASITKAHEAEVKKARINELDEVSQDCEAIGILAKTGVYGTLEMRKANLKAGDE